MRKFGWLLVVAGLAVPAGVIVAQSASAAVTSVSCKTAKANAKVKPGLYKLQKTTPEAHESIQTITATGSLSGCTGGVTGGTMTVTNNVRDPTNCNSVLDSKEPAASPTNIGPVVITWAASKGKTTIGAANLGATTPFTAGALKLSGKVTASTLSVAGLKGKTFTFVLTFKAVPSSGCLTTNLVAATVANKGAVTIK